MNKHKYNEDLVLKFLQNKELAKVEEISNHLKLSSSTIRRILTRLEQNGLVKRNWGGVTVPNQHKDNLQYINEQVFEQRKNLHKNEKHQIALECAQSFSTSQKIFLCCGTTPCLVPQYISSVPQHFISNNLELFKYPQSLHHYTMLAGDYDPVHGAFTMDSLNKIYANVSVLTCSGLSLKTGITSDDKNEALIISKMIEHTIDKVILLIDSSKFNKTSHYKFAELSQMDTIITDNNVSPQTILDYKEQGMNIICAKE